MYKKQMKGIHIVGQVIKKPWRSYMLKNKDYYKVNAFLLVCIFIICVLKIVVVPSGTLEDGISGLYMENENYEYKNLGPNPILRVVIMAESYKSEIHNEVEINGENLEIKYGKNKEKSKIVDSITLDMESEFFEEGSVIIGNKESEKLTISSVKRNYGEAQYWGEFEIFLCEEGLVIINELPLETYLKGVLPSEMPSSYEEEALKVQAICARSYAYKQMQKISYPEYNAHMNDSTDYQVYNNVRETEASNQAILETSGEKLGYQGKVLTTYFFSTSSGYTTDVRAWGTVLNESNEYLKSIKVGNEEGDYEKDLPWYKWSIDIDENQLEEILQLNLSENIGKLTSIEICDKGAGDVVLGLKVTGENKSIILEGENTIRKALGSNSYKITKNDGTSTSGMNLLPSAFFTISKENDKYTIAGGGLGHGIGMSQNGANEMAKLGMSYTEILDVFYQNTEIIL